MSSEGQGSTKPTTPKPGGKDPCWLYGERVGSDTNKVKCKYCTQILNGGISRFKQHLAGKRGNCAPCVKVPDDVKAKVSEIIENTKKSKDEKEIKMHNLLSEVHIGEDEEENNSISLSSQRSSSSSYKVVGPLDSFAARSPEEIAQIVAKGKQPTMDSKVRKKKREDVLRYISKWFYEAGIPFHTATLPSFHQMLQAVGLFGSHLQAPSMYELSETYLQKEVEETKAIVENFKRTCVVNGCSLMTDAWSDRKSRSIMNIVVHSAGRACFLSSHDASADKHDAQYICDFVDKAIDQIGEANVVQIVTDGASNNMAASKKLVEKRPNIFWTTCAAHTVNLMLSDIAKIKPIRNAILMGRSVSVFLYNHTKPLQLFREFTKGDLVRPGVTRFATAFLSLQSLRDHKKEMRQMFISDQWTDCSLSRTSVGKKVAEIIASNKFWDNIDFALKVFTPLVKVLRRADGDKVGSMGFIYGDMLVAMEELKVALGGDEKKYNPILKMIEPRITKNLSGPLHKAGYYLNPFFYYPAYSEIESDGSFMNAVVKCMKTIYPNDHATFTKIGDQIPNYQECLGSFGDQFARRGATKGDCPVTWWRLYGNDTPELRKMAMKILGLTTSSSACERNWSTFEMVKHPNGFKMRSRIKFLQSVTGKCSIDELIANRSYFSTGSPNTITVTLPISTKSRNFPLREFSNKGICINSEFGSKVFGICCVINTRKPSMRNMECSLTVGIVTLRTLLQSNTENATAEPRTRFTILYN